MGRFVPELLKEGQAPSSRYLTRLGVLSIESRNIAWSGIRNVTRIFGWSPDSTRFSVLAPLSASGNILDTRAWVVTAENGRALPIASVRKPSDAVWAPDGRTIVRGTPADNTSSREDWYLVDPNGRSINLTKPFTRVPDRLLPDARNKRLLTVADNSAWSIDPEQGTVRDLLPQLHQAGLSLTEWSTTGNSVALDTVLTLTDTNRSLYRLDLSQLGAKLQHVSRP